MAVAICSWQLTDILAALIGPLAHNGNGVSGPQATFDSHAYNCSTAARGILREDCNCPGAQSSVSEHLPRADMRLHVVVDEKSERGDDVTKCAVACKVLPAASMRDGCTSGCVMGRDCAVSDLTFYRRHSDYSVERCAPMKTTQLVISTLDAVEADSSGWVQASCCQAVELAGIIAMHRSCRSATHSSIQPLYRTCLG